MAEVKWHSVEKEGLPENAKYKGVSCQKYLISVSLFKYEFITVGWFDPYHSCWYCLGWFKHGRLSMKDGVRPEVLKCSDIKGVCIVAWAELPEPYIEG